MQRFSPEELTRKHLLTKMTAKDRARDFSADLYEDVSILFCKVCLHLIDHIRRQTKNRKASGVPQIFSMNNCRKCKRNPQILFGLGNDETAVCSVLKC